MEVPPKKRLRPKMNIFIEMCLDDEEMYAKADLCYREAHDNLLGSFNYFRIRNNVRKGLTVHTSDTSALYVARNDKDEVIGTAFAELVEDGTCFCSHLTVLPAAQRHNVATLLHQVRIDYARNNGCSKIWLEVYEANAAANAGCREIGLMFKGRFTCKGQLPWNRYELIL